jgi:AbrB family looped-hinge helix DNA binding protein
MSKTVTIQPRGQITLPKGTRDALNAKAGDKMIVSMTGPRTVELTLVPRMTLAEMLDLYGRNEPYDPARMREEWEADAAEEVIRSLDNE